nr:hypothetical protein KPHV_12120 [Kitasatospora purpeofusca]
MTVLGPACRAARPQGRPPGGADGPAREFGVGDQALLRENSRVVPMQPVPADEAVTTHPFGIGE